MVDISVGHERFHDSWAKCSQLPVIHGSFFLGSVRFFVPPEDMIALLARSSDGHILGGILPSLNGGQKWHSTSNERITEENILNRFHEFRTPSDSGNHIYEWNLYVRNFTEHRNSFYKELSSFIKGEFTPNLLQKVIDIFSNYARLEVLTITSEKDLRNCEYWFYQAASEWLATVKITPSGNRNGGINLVNYARNSFETQLAEKIGDEIKILLREHSSGKKKSDKKYQDLHINTGDLIDETIRPLSDLKKLKERLKKRFESDVRKRQRARMQKEVYF